MRAKGIYAEGEPVARGERESTRRIVHTCRGHGRSPRGCGRASSPLRSTAGCTCMCPEYTCPFRCSLRSRTRAQSSRTTARCSP
eukprot:1176123-Prorocentrum_minimum.AAC.1